MDSTLQEILRQLLAEEELTEAQAKRYEALEKRFGKEYTVEFRFDKYTPEVVKNVMLKIALTCNAKSSDAKTYFKTTLGMGACCSIQDQNYRFPTHTRIIPIPAAQIKHGNAMKCVNIQDCIVWNEDGDKIIRRQISFYSFYSLAPGADPTDICSYCGHDNGPNSEYRQGFDCGYCGSN